MKVCVIIPTRNEEKSIGTLIQKIKDGYALDIVVVDDGSIDRTSEIARKNGAIVISNRCNRGKGASLIKGFKYCLDNNFDAVITMDGDGQHLPEDISSFVQLASANSSHIFIGNRMSKPKSMPLVRVLTNTVMSWFISFIVKQKIPDTQCGFRFIKKEALQKIKLTTSKYETESELLIKASRLGMEIESVPIKTIYKGEVSRINPVIDTLRFLKFIIKELWTTKN